jgi:hypothetical protein
MIAATPRGAFVELDARLLPPGGRASMIRVGVALVAAVLFAAGCGGGGGKTFSSAAVAQCLRGKNFIVSRTDADFVAQANDGFYVRTSGTASQYGLSSPRLVVDLNERDGAPA